MTGKLKNVLFMLVLTSLVLNMSVPPVHAAAPGSVVINEIAWAGSADSSNDEWIELYNTTGSTIDLSGWSILDDGTSSYDLSGSIEPYGYYLIEDAEAVVNPNLADVIINLSMANTGDSLVLRDQALQVIDAVNSTGAMWPAGDGTTKASMERIDAFVSGDGASNWATSSGSGSSATSSLGSLILGTPGLLNSISQPPQTVPLVDLALEGSAVLGSEINVVLDVSNVTNLFSYGAVLSYDPSMLEFVSASGSDFLDAGNTVPTSFQVGLENGNAGKLIIAEARTMDEKSGVSGSGELCRIVFNVIGGEGQNTSIDLISGSFLADLSGEMTANFTGETINVEASIVNPVTGLSASEGVVRYSIRLEWIASSNATAYRILRLQRDGNWEQIGETSDLYFVDSDAVIEGGSIIPQLNYQYSVVALKNAVVSDPVLTLGVESRGLKADNDRSDRVDGLDLDKIARHFGEMSGDQGFDALVDTTYDGMVDGSDLIDLGADFALTYS